MSFLMDGDKLLKKYKTIWIKIEDLTNFVLNALPVYDDRYIKNKMRTYGDRVYTNFCGLNMPEDDVECEYVQWFLLILYLYMKGNIICKYI